VGVIFCAQYAVRSLYLFTERSRIRQACVWLMKWRWFENFVLLIILANSVVLGLEDMSLSAVNPVTLAPDPDLSWRNWIGDYTEPYFTAAFTIEMSVKVVGMGFILEPHSYLRDGWNWLDFTVVSTSLLSILPGMPRVSGACVCCSDSVRGFVLSYAALCSSGTQASARSVYCVHCAR
jgi:Ion transport protein